MRSENSSSVGGSGGALPEPPRSKDAVNGNGRCSGCFPSLPASPSVAPRNQAAHKRRITARLWPAALLAVALAPPIAANPVLVERVLAVVDGTPLLLSDVRLVERLRGVTRLAALETAIDERLMLQEAQRLSRQALTPDEEEAAFRSLLASTPAAAALPEPALRRLAHRQAAILRYVEFRFRPQVRVTDEELRLAWEQTPEAERADFDAAAPALRETLERRQLDERIEAWVRDLRAAADVRLTPEAPNP